MQELHTSNYFSHNNAQATEIRDRLAEDSLEMLISWLKEGGNVGIHGAGAIESFDKPYSESFSRQMRRIVRRVGGMIVLWKDKYDDN